VAAEVKELPIHAGDLVGAQPQRRLAQPLPALLRVDPFVRRLQGAQREAGALAQVMGRDHDFRLQPLDDRVALAVAQDVLRAVDRQRQHVDTAPALPHLLGRVVAVVAPEQQPHGPDLDQVGHHVHVPGVVRRAGLLAELGERVGPLVPARRHAGVLVGDAGDLDVGEPIAAHHPVEDHRRLHPVDRVVVEMRMGRQGDVGHRCRELLGEP